MHTLGRGSDRQRKGIINAIIASDNLFPKLIRDFRNKFKVLANHLQTDIEAMIKTHLDVVRGTLDIIRSENIATESRQNPEFRARVEAQIGIARDNIQHIQTAVGV